MITVSRCMLCIPMYKHNMDPFMHMCICKTAVHVNMHARNSCACFLS